MSNFKLTGYDFNIGGLRDNNRKKVIFRYYNKSLLCILKTYSNWEKKLRTSSLEQTEIKIWSKAFIRDYTINARNFQYGVNHFQRQWQNHVKGLNKHRAFGKQSARSHFTVNHAWYQLPCRVRYFSTGRLSLDREAESGRQLVIRIPAATASINWEKKWRCWCRLWFILEHTLVKNTKKTYILSSVGLDLQYPRSECKGSSLSALMNGPLRLVLEKIWEVIKGKIFR